MGRLLFAIVIVTAGIAYAAPAFAVECQNYCVGKCAGRPGNSHTYCMNVCVPRCEEAVAKKKKK